MQMIPIENVIKEKNIIVFAPHFDDSILIPGNYFLEMKDRDFLRSKNIEVVLIFSRSNYLARTEEENYDTSLDRIKLATGKRFLEDLECLDELLGEFGYKYRILGEKECLLRSKILAKTGMEFPWGMYEDFNGEDWAALERVRQSVMEYAANEDTALIFPLAFKEHIDHFIVREAGLKAAKELGPKARAAFYFQEDKPYSGLTDDDEALRIEKFLRDHSFEKLIYKAHPEKLIELSFKHYISQVEEIYETGIQHRSKELKKKYGASYPCDQIYLYKN